MTTEEIEQTMRKAIATYGVPSQLMMAFEEMGELMSAIGKFERGRIGLDDVCTEIADVKIMMEQLSLIYNPVKVDEEYQRKVERLKCRLQDKESKK